MTAIFPYKSPAKLLMSTGNAGGIITAEVSAGQMRFSHISIRSRCVCLFHTANAVCTASASIFLSPRFPFGFQTMQYVNSLSRKGFLCGSSIN
jgi:hypothetical protein